MDDSKNKSNISLVEPLTARELEVLQLVTEGLSNRDIADKLFVALSTVKWHIKQIYGKLQVETRDEAIARASDLGLVDREPESSALPSHNLPFQATPLIGRERELAELAALLDDPHTRLVTIIGPGGMGKTRLALEVAQAQLRHFTNGVFFVSLAPLSSPEFIVSHIADAVGFVFHQGTDPKQQLIDYLREKQMLLMLDNFEHLLDGASIVSDVQAAAPAVKALVTSREILNVYGETVYTISGIAYPTIEQPLEEAVCYGAIKLFEQSARRANANFRLEDDNIAAVIRICERLQGIPLAIEMATAWVRMLSLDEIGMEIARSLDFLATTRRDVIERHRTMRAVFDHSWHLLQPEEQRVFRALSVFRGGFQRQAAERVAGASLASLSALTDKSLVHWEPTGCYHIHELVRQYAAEKLGEVSEQEDEAQNRHCAYYAAFVHQRTEQMQGVNQRLALNEFSREITNIRLGWQRALTTWQFEKIEQYMEGFLLFHDMRFQNWDAIEVFDMAVTWLGDEGGGLKPVDARQKRLYALALVAKCMFNVWFPTFQGTRALLDEALAILDQFGTQMDKALPFFALGLLDYVSGNYVQAKPRFQDSLALYAETGDQWGKQLNFNMLGRVAYRLGEYEQAQELLEEGLKTYQDDRFGTAQILGSLGRVLRAVGQYEQAEHMFREELVLFQELGSPWGIAYAMNDLGEVIFRQGNLAAAHSILHESLENFTRIGMQSYIMTRAIRTLGTIAHILNDYHLARHHFHDALRLATTTRTIPDTLDTLVSIAELFTKEGQKEQALELVTLVLQQTTLSYETKRAAEGLFARLESELAPEVFADLLERAKTLHFESVIEHLITELET
jgi:predicted ATPase/DNA-binding CsgD family transcriptional regulator/tetratricopeptide (TPR) repeat protein